MLTTDSARQILHQVDDLRAAPIGLDFEPRDLQSSAPPAP
jgi:hypothetical protein